MGKANDMISGLPDDVIINILSYLHLKEAGRTSLLSKRWRHTWTFLPDLDFDDSYNLYLLTGEHEPPPLPRRTIVNNYVNWVNQVLASHNPLRLNSIKIHFVLHQIFSSDIDKWLHFTMIKNKVRNLKLNFGTLPGYPVLGAYCLTSFFNHYIKYKIYNHSLQSLTLVAANASVMVFRCILANCPNLEHLSLSHCLELDSKASEKFAVSSLKLKLLHINYCTSIGGVELFAPNLTSFAYVGWSTTVVEFHHVPNLVEAAFGGAYCTYMLCNLHSLAPSLSSQLQKLSLKLFDQVCYNSNVLAVALSSLQQLELVVYTNINFLCLTSFIVACPLLHTFKLKVLPWTTTPAHKPVVAMKDPHGDGEDAKPKDTHKKLKTIKYVGFDGSASSVALALCLIDISPLLEEFILDCRIPRDIGEPHTKQYGDWHTDKVRLFTEAAQDLAANIRHIKLVRVVIM